MHILKQQMCINAILKKEKKKKKLARCLFPLFAYANVCIGRHCLAFNILNF